MSKTKVLVLVEGAKNDARLMQRLFKVYNIIESHQIISYKTNIYTLYNSMFKDSNPEDIDIIEHLKAHEPDYDKKQILIQDFPIYY